MFSGKVAKESFGIFRLLSTQYLRVLSIDKDLFSFPILNTHLRLFLFSYFRRSNVSKFGFRLKNTVIIKVLFLLQKKEFLFPRRRLIASFIATMIKKRCFINCARSLNNFYKQIFIFCETL